MHPAHILGMGMYCAACCPQHNTKAAAVDIVRAEPEPPAALTGEQSGLFE
jgi:hypothetical protein